MKSASLEQMMADMNNGTYDLTCNNYRKYIKKHHINEHRHNYPTATPTMDMTCPFLDDDKAKEKCEIYSVRPRICREFICCPSKRPQIDDWDYKLKCKVVDVRKEFFE